MENGTDSIKESDRLRRSIDNLKKEIELTCKKIGRESRDITIVAAVKYASAGQVKSVYDLGIKNFGENRADQLEEKYNSVKGGPIWHFIGHLQSRKLDKIQKLLIEVNISGEQSKYGINQDDLHDFIEKSLNFKNIEIAGLMTVAPLTDDSGYLRDIFRRLKILRDGSNKDFNIMMRELSMGMSN